MDGGGAGLVDVGAAVFLMPAVTVREALVELFGGPAGFRVIAVLALA